MNKRKLLIAAGVAVLSFLAGRYSSPAKIEEKVVEKIVYRESATRERNSNVEETEKETILPDGTIIRERSKKKETDSTIRRDIGKDTYKESTKIISNRPSYRASLVYEPAVTGLQDLSYQGLIERRIIGEIYLGVSASSKNTYGVVISIGF